MWDVEALSLGLCAGSRLHLTTLSCGQSHQWKRMERHFLCLAGSGSGSLFILCACTLLCLPYSRQIFLHGVHWQRPSTLIYGVINGASPWFINCAPSIGSPLIEIFKGHQKSVDENPANLQGQMLRSISERCLLVCREHSAWSVYEGVRVQQPLYSSFPCMLRYGL